MQKRRLPCAWIYMKRRRTKDYIRVAKVSEQIMVDFEIAAKRAFEKTFLRCTIKGCAFHFGQSLFQKVLRNRIKASIFESTRAAINLTNNLGSTVVVRRNNDLISIVECSFIYVNSIHGFREHLLYV